MSLECLASQVPCSCQKWNYMEVVTMRFSHNSNLFLFLQTITLFNHPYVFLSPLPQMHTNLSPTTTCSPYGTFVHSLFQARHIYHILGKCTMRDFFFFFTSWYPSPHFKVIKFWFFKGIQLFPSFNPCFTARIRFRRGYMI